MIKTSEKNWTQYFDASMSSFSSEKKPFFFHLKMMKQSHQNFVSNTSKSIKIQKNKILSVFMNNRGTELEYTEKNLSLQSRESTNSTYPL